MYLMNINLELCFVLSGDRQVIPRPGLGQVSHGRHWGVCSKVSTSLTSSTLLHTKVHFNNKFKIIIIGYFSSLFKHDSTQKDTGYTWVSLFRFRFYAQCWCASIPQVQKGYDFFSCIPTTPNGLDCLSWVTSVNRYVPTDLVCADPKLTSCRSDGLFKRR